MKPVSCNSWICAMNAYWTWSGEYNPTAKQGKHLSYLNNYRLKPVGSVSTESRGAAEAA
jgi:hypothetical protein